MNIYLIKLIITISKGYQIKACERALNKISATRKNLPQNQRINHVSHGNAPSQCYLTSRIWGYIGIDVVIDMYNIYQCSIAIWTPITGVLSASHCTIEPGGRHIDKLTDDLHVCKLYVNASFQSYLRSRIGIIVIDMYQIFVFFSEIWTRIAGFK